MLIIDSSILISLDRAGKLKETLESLNKKHRIIVPPSVAKEIVDDPKVFTREIESHYPEKARKI
ncbi:MAG: hypothetical protein ACE5J3_04175, partial [Methanosarcinales archaeon]